jgi:hypothetical protein
MILLESLPEEHFGRAFSHPQRGLMTIDKAIQLYAWHGLHHTAHIMTCAPARDGEPGTLPEPPIGDPISG